MNETDGTAGLQTDQDDPMGRNDMADILGTISGRLTVTSASGSGTTIRGEIPL